MRVIGHGDLRLVHRFPGEPIEQCMKRELFEETGLTLSASLTDIGDEDWYVYYAEADPDTDVVLSEEHDRFKWVPVEEAAVRCRPEIVGNQIRELADLLRLL